MKKVGVGPLSFQSWYAARYEMEPASRSVRWRSVAGRGNTDVVGSWRIEPQTNGTCFTLEVSFALELPLPGLRRGAVQKRMAIENDRIVGQYLTALQATLDRGAT
ncbi:MAG: hypothetical protein EXR77_18545 [Myxococcales bacterium]|nr:hypothetical protein [Myxococcales bacterium]